MVAKNKIRLSKYEKHYLKKLYELGGKFDGGMSKLVEIIHPDPVANAYFPYVWYRIKRLEEKGFVKIRKQNRKNIVELTSKGKFFVRKFLTQK